MRAEGDWPEMDSKQRQLRLAHLRNCHTQHKPPFQMPPRRSEPATQRHPDVVFFAEALALVNGANSYHTLGTDGDRQSFWERALVSDETSAAPVLAWVTRQQPEQGNLPPAHAREARTHGHTCIHATAHRHTHTHTHTHAHTHTRTHAHHHAVPTHTRHFHTFAGDGR